MAAASRSRSRRSDTDSVTSRQVAMIPSANGTTWRLRIWERPFVIGRPDDERLIHPWGSCLHDPATAGEDRIMHRARHQLAHAPAPRYVDASECFGRGAIGEIETEVDHAALVITHRRADDERVGHGVERCGHQRM